MIEVAFYKGKHRLFDRLVQWWTRGPYSHTEVVLPQSAALSTCISASWRDGGVRMKTIALDPARWDVFCVDIDQRTALEWLVQHEGKKYDLLGLFGFVWRARRDNPHRWFCSESTAAILGFPEPWRLSPNDLASILKKKKGVSP